MKKVVIVAGAVAVLLGTSVAFLGLLLDSEIGWRFGLLLVAAGVGALTAGLVLLVHEAKLAAIAAHRKVGELRTSLLSRIDQLDRTTAAMDDSLTASIADFDASVGDTLVRSTEARREELADLERTMRQLHEVGLASSIEIEMSVKDAMRAISSLYTQAESLLRVRDLFPDVRPLPPFRDWAVSPDLADYLAHLMIDNRPSDVVEIGSGSSTLILAAAARANGVGHVVAIEHLEMYAQATQRLLDGAALAEWATVLTRPLRPVDVAGETYDWYALQDGDLPPSIDLLIVDGPPGTVGEHARYPALAILRPLLNVGTQVILDDANRPDEKQIIERWIDEVPELGVTYVGHEKGTAVLTVRADGEQQPA